jgi:outer membrane immunogenic protein
VLNSKLIISAAAAISAIAGIGAASAADLPARTYTKAPAMADPAYNWSGWYVGGNVGAAWSRTDYVTTNTPGVPAGIFGVPANIALVNTLGTGSANQGGKFTGGVQAGYNWQVSPQWLLGVEADINSLRQNPSLIQTGVSTEGPITLANTTNTNWLATFRGRAGLTFNRTLLYVTGGAALTDRSYTQTFNAPGLAVGNTFGTSVVSDTRVGWTVGAGVEQALWGAWTVKGEYLFTRFNGIGTATLVSVAGFTQNLTGNTGNLDIQVARVGLNYRFGGPVVARY